MTTRDMFLPPSTTAPGPHPQPVGSTPLDDGADHGDFPTPLLWAMKEHRRVHLDLLHEPVGERLGEGDGAVWVIDTGHSHCTIGRVVGTGPDGVVYCLVASVKGEAYAKAAADPSAVGSIFSHAHHPILVGVYKGGVSNVFDVARYEGPQDIPAEYLPGHPPVEFAQDPEPGGF